MTFLIIGKGKRMFAAIRNFFRHAAPMPPGLTPEILALKIGQMPSSAPPKGKRWCLGLNDRWSLVDIEKVPRRRKSSKKRL